MNKIYKVIYCKATQAWVAVSELAKGRSKGGTRSSRINRTEFFSGRVKILSAAVMLALGGQAYAGGCPGLNGSTVECGSGSDASGSRAVAIGHSAKATGSRSLAVGEGTEAAETQSVAIGSKNTKALGDQSIAIGGDTVASGADSIAIGGDDLDKVANDSPPPWNATGLTNAGFNTSAVATKYHDQTGQWLVDVTGGPSTRYIKAEAKGAGSVVLGVQSKAVGDLATAIGTGSKAEAFGSTAFGIGAKATKENSIALGAGSVTDSDAAWVPQATIDTLDENGNTVGTLTYTKFAGGSVNLAEGDQVSVGSAGFERQIKNVAPGEISATSTDAINGSQLAAVAGKLQYQTQTYFHVNENNASQGAGNATTNFGAIRDKAGATGAFAITAGVNAQATQEGGIAIGHNAKADGFNAVVLGGNGSNIATADYAVAMGYTSKATNKYAISIGRFTEASGEQSVAIGHQAKATATDAVALGRNTTASGANSTAMGVSTTASGANSTTIGNYTTASGENSTAMGYVSKAIGKNSTAMGAFSNAKGENSLATQGGTAHTENSIAIGTGTAAGVDGGAQKAVAMGYGATATANQSMALGFDANASADSTVAIGDGTKATIANSVALGQGSTTSVDAGQVGADPLGAATSTANSTWTATAAAVSVGNGTTITRQITSVAAGTNDTDAVNVAQLKAAGFKLTTSASADGEVSGTTVEKVQNGETVTVDAAKNIKVTQNGQKISIATKDEVEFTKTTVGNVVTDATTNKITGLEAGDINATSKDAVNGSQLFTTNTNVSNNATEIAKGINFGGTTGSNKYVLGDTMNVKGDSNITSTTVAGGVQLGLADNVTIGNANPVTINGTAGNIGGLANTTFDPNNFTSGQAATEDQLSLVSATANAGFSITGASPTTAADAQIKPNDIFTIVGDTANTDFSNSDAGKNIYTVVDADNTVRIGLANDLDVTSVKAQTVNATTSLTIGDATDPANSTTLTSGANGLDVGGDKITNVAAGVADTDAVNVSQLTTQIAGSKEEVKSDDKSVIVTTTQNAAGANIFDLSVNADGTTIEVEPGTGKVKAVTSDITSNPTGAVTATTPSSLATAGDIANAINNSGFTAKANGDTGELINPGDEVEFLNGDNIEITRTGGKFTIATAKDVSFDSVTAGDTVMNNDGITINNGAADNPVVLGKSGLDNGGNTITNVAAGVADTDAVNVSQLTTQIAGSKEEVKSDDKSVTVTTTQNAAGSNIFDLSVNADGTTIEVEPGTGKVKAVTSDITSNPTGAVTATTPSSLATAGDIANAINNSGFTAKANGDTGELINPGDEVEFLNGDNIEITRTGGQFTIATAKDVSFDSVTAGDTVMNNDGITINNGAAGNPVVLGKSGLDNGGNTITNVAAGVADTDAVNVSQLTTQIAGSKEEVKSDDKSVTVTTTQNAAGANIFDLSVNADGTTIEVEPGTGKVKAVTSDITSNPTGAVTATTPSSLATAGDIANAINNSGFTAKANGDTGELINPGDEVEFLNGDNIEITRTGGKFTIATAKDVSFDSVTAGDSKIDNNGLTINGGPSVTKAGINAGDKQIKGVSSGLVDAGGNPVTIANATGDTLTNAANIGDLQKVQGSVINVNNLIGGTDINDPAVKDALKTYDVSGQTATNDNSIISAIKNMNEGGIKYFHTNDDSGQKTGGAVANTNDSSASGKFATAVGYQASATAEGAIAIGKGSQATGQNSIAIGTGHKVTGNNSGAIGDPTYINADNSYAIGNNNTIAAGSDKVFILGNDVNVGAGHTGAVVLGDQSTIDSVHTGDYTYGGVADAKVSGSKGAGTQVVSVGSVGGERQIQNVAPGVISDSSTDAVNGSQLYVVGKAVSINSTAINANSTAIGANSAAISNNVYHIGKNTGKINDNRIQINANTATIGKGINIGSDSGDTVNRQLGDTIAITGDKNITTKTTDKGVQVTLNPDISADSLTAGNTLVNHDGVIISGGNNGDIMLTNNGLDNGGNRVKNVAAGINDTDAVNVSQLKEAYQHIDGVKDDASAGIAAAIAMANMPQPHDPGASMMSLGVGAHRDQQAIAIGLSTISDNGKWILKGSLSQDTQDNVSAGVGVGYQW